MHRLPSIFCIALLVIASLLSSIHAVEKEDSVDTTLSELVAELNIRIKTLDSQLPMFDRVRNDYLSRKIVIGNELSEMAVVLYSQALDNMFSLAFYCKKIAELESDYYAKQFPFKRTTELIDNEISKLTKLRQSIQDISTEQLSENGAISKESAIEKCNMLEAKMTEFRTRLNSDEGEMNSLGTNIASINTYAKTQMDEMMKRMFLEPSISFQNASVAWLAFSDAIKKNYFPSDEPSSRMKELKSIWLRIIIFVISSYILSFGVFHIVLKKSLQSRPGAIGKTPFYTFAGTLAFLGVFLLFSRHFQTLDFINSIINIAAEFVLISAMIILALVARLDKENASTGIKFYLPSILLCLFFILLRMSMAPNIIVNFLLPILFPITAVCQIIVMVKYKAKLERIDRGFGNVSLILFIISTLLCWNGYSYMAFLVNLVWIMLMASILVMLAIWKLLHLYQEKRSALNANANKMLRPFISKLLFPILSVLMIIFSCLWPCSIFDITHIITGWASTPINIPDFVSRLSLNNLVTIIIIGFALNYLILITKNMIRDIYQDNYETEAVATYVTLGTLLLWTAFTFISLASLGVNFNGILVVMGGMSMGIGFALKDTIDNVICGLSLIFGRLRQGDVVECDGIRGKVSSVGFRTTFIETLDGSVIGFQNNQLFNKNFRNLTKNHLYESVKVEIGIAYGTDVQQARELILEAVRQVETLPRTRTSSVVLDSFGDNSVNLGVWVWVPVRNKPATLSRVRECIYQAFNENGITIPFPQQDVYIREMPNQTRIDEEK